MKTPAIGRRLSLRGGNPEHIAPSLVKPGHDDQAFAGHNPFEAGHKRRTDLKPGIGSTL